MATWMAARKGRALEARRYSLKEKKAMSGETEAVYISKGIIWNC